MNYVSILVYILTFCAGGIGGYYAGRYTRGLMNEIRTLKEQRREPTPEPTITAGAYTPPKAVSTAVDNSPVGLVESKTPERMAFEQDQAIEKEALHIGPQ